MAGCTTEGAWRIDVGSDTGQVEAAVDCEGEVTMMPPPPWSPSRWTKKGAYDAVMCETTPFWWKPLNKMMLLESVCSGP